MNTADQNALLTIALLAAFADGSKADAERAEVRRVAESLGSTQINMAALHQDVLLKRATVVSAAAALSSPELGRIGKGFQFVTVGSDARILAAGSQEILRNMRSST
jgi:2-hydroxychromene-2-carboxylate isomerase